MSKKFIAVLNKAADPARLVNALGHISVGLAGNTNQFEKMEFIEYKDNKGGIYPNISRCPFIVLKGNENKIKQFREALIEIELPYSCFLDTMIEGGSDVQVENTLKKTPEELSVLAIVTFGERDILDPLTKKFSIWSFKANGGDV